MGSHFRPWLPAWADAAYSATGFWRSARPQDHFATASLATSQQAAGVLGILDEHPTIRTVVELGAGDGRLLDDLAAARSDLRLYGVDLRARPDSLSARVGWVCDLFDVVAQAWRTPQLTELLALTGEPVLVVCAEWLDDLPCAVATRTGAGIRLVEVDGNGAERVGPALDGGDAAWAARWSPEAPRLEIGSTRDQAWASVCRLLRPQGGLALLIDYGHLGEDRPPAGTLAAYQRGQRVTPRPSREVNLTAAVAVDAVTEAGHLAGATTLRQARQREVLAPPPVDHGDPFGALLARNHHAAATSPRAWGDQWWLLQHVAGRG